MMQDNAIDIKIGYCRFCGKSRMVEDGGADPDLSVTMRCDCDAAARARHMVELRQHIAALCADNGRMLAVPPQATEAIMRLAQECYDGCALAVTVNLADGSRLKIKCGKKAACVEATRELTIMADPMEQDGIDETRLSDYMQQIERTIQAE